MIRIGNQTSCWTPTPTEPFDYALANGFDAFEWFPDKKPGAGWDDSDLGPEQRKRIREAAAAKGLRLSVHARWQANPLHPESRELFQRDIELAKDLGAVLLNIHLCHEAGIERFVGAITTLIEQTAEAGLQLSIENTPEHSPEQFNELFARLRELNSISTARVGMCLDIGHANLSGATRNNYLAFVDRLAREMPIIHLHLHENWGDGDTHLTLFTGPAGRNDSGVLGLVERIRKRNFSGSIIFEQWPQPPSLLNQARERLMGLLEVTGKGTHESGQQETEVGRGVPTAPKESDGRGENAFFDALVEGDKRARSWREKLDAVREPILSKDTRLGKDELAYIAIYLRFLSTGQVACVEDGRHFRPAHHARISQEIQERLASLSTPENTQFIRKIYATLPSSAQAFQRAEPLTRIRDIAHRNDIPSDLKREIKTTLQNKLHRCAGPEDLATSTALLERITAPGANYSSEFVEQFGTFHEELKEFFNARSLDDRLNALVPLADARQAELIRSFLQQKLETGFTGQVSALKGLTGLRESFGTTIQGGTNTNQQESILADIGLEDFAFVLVSRLLNAFEAAEPRRSAVELLDPLGLVVRNLAISGISTDECGAIIAELNAWKEKLDPGECEQLLRLKATIERCRRFAEAYSDEVISSLLSRAETLGRALDVAEHAIRVFSEAEIRSHLAFQLSKMASLLLRRLREALELPPWDILVTGQAEGRVRVLYQLGQLGEDGAEPVIAVLDKVEGDEEIPKTVRAILVAHEIPHLSHLGVRARQAGVVFVGTEEAANLQPLKELNDQTIHLETAPDKVQWKTVQGSDKNETGGRANKEPVSETKIAPIVLKEGSALVLSLDQVTAETGGQKAFGLRGLTQLSLENEDGFSVPSAMVIPFGLMEKIVSSDKEKSVRYRELVGEIDGMVAQGSESTTKQLRELIEQIDVPHELTSAIAKNFQPSDRLMVRSSANCEDLEDFAGAGLYESIPNVAPTEVASAVRRVWSSLWTRRAVLSRKQVGIPHESAQMAVIIQQMLAPDYSFVLHTVNPLSQNTDEVYAELAVGLGETLASAVARGTPYRLVCNKKSGEVQTLAFANFSHALTPASNGEVDKELLDYSRVSLSRDLGARKELGRRLGNIAGRVENAFQKAQDIEGAVVGEKIYLVQSRPQQGL